ncbi:putative mitochondrial protein import protein MAS5 [Apiospora hydei]|uniref:Mitochondrial protein import protein MAS5 n=1 Tax=Apiospora hydei TaxID=1337664 RepID=A0ABR1WAF3_9PEZI
MTETFGQKPSLAECYRTLGLSPGADEAEVKAAFRKLSLKHHPDRAGGTPANNAKFAEIRNAFEDISDYLAEPKQERWAEPPGGFPPGAGRGGFPGGAGSSYGGYGGYGGGGYPGAPPPGYGGGRGRPEGRSYFPMDDPDFGEFFDAASEFMFGEKGRFPGMGSSSSRGPPPSRGFPSGGFPPGMGGFPPGYGRSSSSGMPPRGYGDFPSSGGGYPRGGGGGGGGRYGDFDPFSGRGGSSSSRGPGRDQYSSGYGKGGSDEGEPAPPREDKLAVIQWSLRRAHRRLAPLPGKLFNMRRWWDKVDECGDLSPKQRVLGRERFDRAELHLAKMLSQATEQMESVRNHQDKKEKKKKSSSSNRYSKMSGKSEGKGKGKKKQLDKWAMPAMQLGRDSEAVLNEVIALEQCAKHDDLNEFLAALSDIKSGGGSGKKQGQEDGSSEEDESSSGEESSDAGSGSESG